MLDVKINKQGSYTTFHSLPPGSLFQKAAGENRSPYIKGKFPLRGHWVSVGVNLRTGDVVKLEGLLRVEPLPVGSSVTLYVKSGDCNET